MNVHPTLFTRTLPLVLLVACNGLQPNEWRHDGKSEDTGDSSTDTDTDADGDTDTDADTDADSDTDTGEKGDFDVPGDIVEFESDEEGIGTVNLTDVSGDSNQDQEFYLLLVNAGASSMGYRLWYSLASEEEAKTKELPAPPVRSPSLTRPAAPLPLASPPATAPGYTIEDIGVTQDEFFVRDDMSDESSYTVVVATLFALGSSVSIWVDNDVPIDFDADGNGSISEEEEHEYDSFGFDNTDLQEIAAIVDSNILPNLTSLFGAMSDVNEDGMVTVLITPVLNRLPITSADEDDWLSVVASYAEPSVDLLEFDAEERPGSNEQEIIYVFAPDPYGFYNPFYRTQVSSYTGMSLSGQIAQVSEQLISYNQHVIVLKGLAEEGWVNAGLGALAADLTGFGAINFNEAWDYIDAPYLYPLTSWNDSGEVVSTEPKGAQYLFFRWLVDLYGPGIMAELVQTSDTGVGSVEAAVEAMKGSESMAELVLKWQMALLTTGVTLGKDTTPLVDPDLWPPYADATLIDAPPADPGDYYGANGYQMGVNVHGYNVVMQYGNTDIPSEDISQSVRMENSDHFTYTPGFPFYGYIQSDYAAQVIRLTDVAYERTLVEMQANSTEYYGAVIRWNDTVVEDVAVENIYSATDANAVALPTIGRACQPIYAIGDISEDGLTVIVDDESGKTTAYVADTDRWQLDLSAFPESELLHVSVALDRRFSDESGTPAPFDPWIAVFPSEWVPTPTVDSVSRDICADADAYDFKYPFTILQYLFSQVFLVDNPIGAEEIEGESEFDACGEAADDGSDDTAGESEATTSCLNDWDGDGVIDSDEPLPESVNQQVLVRLCELGWSDTPTLANYDIDSIDEDDEPYTDRRLNLGGMSSNTGEEAYIEIDLEGGARYLILVGGSGERGSYELTIQQTGCEE